MNLPLNMDFQQIFNSLNTYYHNGNTKSYSFRKKQLLELKKAIKRKEADIVQALSKDLHKSAMETYTTEIGFVYEEINYTLQHLKEWMQPETVSTPMIAQPSSSKIYKDPLGITLIIAPWNYPLQLILAPLVGSIAGGNCTILKPSEETPHICKVIEELINETFDKKYITVINGEGATVVPQLMEFPFNHVFFTGSVAVGKKIMAMAAKHLTPVTLELGGKSPCIVDETANLKIAAKRIVWGKFINAGQTCVAPDYILVHHTVKNKLCDLIKEAVLKFYGDDPKKSSDYPRIINAKRFNTVSDFFKNGKIIFGGETDLSELYISPTLLDNITWEDEIMQQEIFGPVLPVLTYQNITDVPSLVNKNAYPLALYIFTGSKKNEKFIIENIRFGSGCVNDTLMHLSNPSIPFGGIGTSGSGNYHGKFSFDTFTHTKGMLKTSTWLDIPFRYPPYGKKEKLVRMFMK